MYQCLRNSNAVCNHMRLYWMTTKSKTIIGQTLSFERGDLLYCCTMVCIKCIIAAVTDQEEQGKTKAQQRTLEQDGHGAQNSHLLGVDCRVID